MSVLGFFLFALVFGVLPLVILYLVIEGETSNPIIVDRSEAERLAKERGGRPEHVQDDSDQATAEWGTDSQWGSETEGCDR